MIRNLNKTLQDKRANKQGAEPEVIFAGKIFDLVRDRFDYNGEQLTREYLRHPGAVAVLAINSKNQVLTVKQYRRPVDSYLLELPAGLRDATDESTLDTAKRELLEETDYVAENWQHLHTFLTSPGCNDEVIEIFLATGLTKIEHDYDRTAEERDMQVDWHDLTDVVDAVLNSKAQSPTLTVGILHYLAIQGSKQNG